MASIKILSPKVEEYILTVSIPWESSIIIMKDETIIKVEEIFIFMRDRESNHSKKIEYDRARALMKWANCCNARLVSMTNTDHKLKVSFGFREIIEMLNFRDSMEVNVSGATMR